MRVALLAFDGFNELDAFIALGLISQLRTDGWSAEIASPSAQVTSMNGLTVTAQQPLAFANKADVVLFASGLYSRAVAESSALLDTLQLDPVRQLIGGQCSGTLLMARLGLMGMMPACADTTIKPWLVEAGVLVLDEPFNAQGPVATAAGSLASQYMAAWVLAKGSGLEAARWALRRAAPVGQQDAYAERVLNVVTPYLN